MTAILRSFAALALVALASCGGSADTARTADLDATWEAWNDAYAALLAPIDGLPPTVTPSATLLGFDALAETSEWSAVSAAGRLCVIDYDGRPFEIVEYEWPVDVVTRAEPALARDFDALVTRLEAAVDAVASEADGGTEALSKATEEFIDFLRARPGDDPSMLDPYGPGPFHDRVAAERIESAVESAARDAVRGLRAALEVRAAREAELEGLELRLDELARRGARPDGEADPLRGTASTLDVRRAELAGAFGRALVLRAEVRTLDALHAALGEELERVRGLEPAALQDVEQVRKVRAHLVRDLSEFVGWEPRDIDDVREQVHAVRAVLDSLEYERFRGPVEHPDRGAWEERIEQLEAALARVEAQRSTQEALLTQLSASAKTQADALLEGERARRLRRSAALAER